MSTTKYFSAACQSQGFYQHLARHLPPPSVLLVQGPKAELLTSLQSQCITKGVAHHTMSVYHQ